MADKIINWCIAALLIALVFFVVVLPLVLFVLSLGV